MKNHDIEIVDLALTQAIEHYMELGPGEVFDVIVTDWPDQIAVLLVEFFFKSTCWQCGGINDFIEIERQSGHGNYIAAICGCEMAPMQEPLPAIQQRPNDDAWIWEND